MRRFPPLLRRVSEAANSTGNETHRQGRKASKALYSEEMMNLYSGFDKQAEMGGMQQLRSNNNNQTNNEHEQSDIHRGELMSKQLCKTVTESQRWES